MATLALYDHIAPPGAAPYHRTVWTNTLRRPQAAEAIVRARLSLSVAMTGCITRNPNLETGLRQTEAGIGTAPTMPGFAESDEATAEELERAHDQGNAERRELEW